MGKDLEQIRDSILAKTNVTYVQISYIHYLNFEVEISMQGKNWKSVV